MAKFGLDDICSLSPGKAQTEGKKKKKEKKRKERLGRTQRRRAKARGWAKAKAEDMEDVAAWGGAVVASWVGAEGERVSLVSEFKKV